MRRHHKCSGHQVCLAAFQTQLLWFTIATHSDSFFEKRKKEIMKRKKQHIPAWPPWPAPPSHWRTLKQPQHPSYMGVCTHGTMGIDTWYAYVHHWRLACHYWGEDAGRGEEMVRAGWGGGGIAACRKLPGALSAGCWVGVA